MNTIFTLTSSAFEEGGTIPAEYSCDGDQLSPPLNISGAPEGTRSFVLIMDDPDIPQTARETPGIRVFDHWVVYNIAADTTDIAEGAPLGELGVTSAGGTAYVPPCPPPQHEPREHRYVFSLYALSDSLDFPEPPTAEEVRAALAHLLLAETKLIGRYSRK